MFFLVRHGETDYSEKGTKIYQGYGENFAPLSPQGIKQIYQTAKDLREVNADVIISSPYTRALQTAAILSKELQVDIEVETDIHEWLPDKNYHYLEPNIAENHCREFNAYNGDYPKNAELIWESNAVLRRRLHSTLDKYGAYTNVIVVCHGMLIHSVYKTHWLENGEYIEYVY